MNPIIGRRGFFAALVLASSSVIALPAWADERDGSLLISGRLEEAFGSADLDGIDDEEIARIVDGLNDIDGIGSGAHMQALSASEVVSSTTIAGDDRFKTAVELSKAAYPSGASKAIIVNGDTGWPDALTAACLSAAVDAPILFCSRDSVPPATTQELKRLGAKGVIVIGSSSVVGAGALSALASSGYKNCERIEGSDRQGTQLAIFQYGLDKGYWNKDLIMLAVGSNFPDALAGSPIAFALKAPIFITGTSGGLSEAQKIAWQSAATKGYGKRVVVLGSETVVPASTKAFADSMRKMANGSGVSERLAGPDRYATSAEIAKWAVKEQGFTWNNAAFTTGEKPWDALAGSAYQGKSKSVLLLVDDPNESTIMVASENRDDISHVRFFGDTNAVSSSVRSSATVLLSDRVLFESTGLSLSRMLDLEVAASMGYQGYSRSDIDDSLNPAHFGYGSAEYYQFAVVNTGYSGKVSASQLNGFINTSGSDGMLAGRGQDFIDAAKQYSTNEVYLLAHAILESGWGKSQLARGNVVDGTTYYNFFGIGAVDSNPLGGGASTAGKYGWNTPRYAILGAAQWIQSNYHENKYNQNTLYKMKWNYVQAASESTVWKQYATGRTWAAGIAAVMERCYAYCGLNMDSCGLAFRVPLYS